MAHIDGRTSHDTHPPALPPLDTEVISAPGPAAVLTPTVTLRRLLGLATLTPRQAVHVANEVLALLDGANRPGVDTDAVTVDKDGAIRLLTERAARDGDATADLVDELGRNADRPVARRNPVSTAQLAALARCAAALHDGDRVAARAALLASTRPSDLDGHDATRELAALVAVPLRPTTAVRPAPPVRKRPPAEPRRAPVSPQPPPQRARSRRRLITSIVIAALVVIGAASAIALIRPGGSGSPSGNSTPPPSASTPPGTHHARHSSAAGAARHHGVPALAPASARAISKVTMTPVARCRAGTSCAVTVRVWLRPPWLSSLHWHAAAVNRCTGHVRRLASGSMIAHAGWRSAYATVQVPVPHKPRLALIAVVDKPVSAASRPLFVTTGSRGCG